MKYKILLGLIIALYLLCRLSFNVYASDIVVDNENNTVTVNYDSPNYIYVQVESDVNSTYYPHHGSCTYSLTEQGSYSIKVLEQVSGTGYRVVYSDFFYVDSECIDTYLLETMAIDLDQSIVDLSNRIVADGSKRPEELLFDFVIDTVRYDMKSVDDAKDGSYIVDVKRTLKTGKGLCIDYSSLYASLMRAQGIPTKVVYGYYADCGYHAWNEAYIDGEWVSMDATMCDFNCDYGFGIDELYLETSSY